MYNEHELYMTEQQIRRYRIKRGFAHFGIYFFLTIVALFVIIPFYWMIATALRTTEELKQLQVGFFPAKWQFRNFIDSWRYAAGKYTMEINGKTVLMRPSSTGNIGIAYLNTIFVGFATTSLAMICTTLSAFAFARLNFKLKPVLFMLMLATMMVPGEIFIITNYATISMLNWRDTYVALIAPFIVSVFYTYFLRQTFKQIPDELYFAAKVDGTGDFKYLFKVMIPLAKSTMITIFILSMMGTWNAYIWPNLVTESSNRLLVSNALMRVFKADSEFSEGLRNPVHFQMAMATLITLPLLVVFVILRKYIMRGVARGGTKG